MTCSQKFVSLVSGTTRGKSLRGIDKLWLALKSLYLWYPEQQFSLAPLSTNRCDLLSKVCIFGIRNNGGFIAAAAIYVVTCSQKFVSLVSGTTDPAHRAAGTTLWLALKSLYLWYPEQRNVKLIIPFNCCDLLSKVCIFGIRNNQIRRKQAGDWVVTCSQKFVSLVSGTTDKISTGGDRGCDLLSKVCIFGIRNNVWWNVITIHFVVTCSQKFVSLVSGTTCDRQSFYDYELWLALKSLYLWYPEQPEMRPVTDWDSCDLLSKVCIFGIRNNAWLSMMHLSSVVTCSQKFVSLVSGTTKAWTRDGHSRLWLALKSLYLWYPEQHFSELFLKKKSCDLLSKVCIFGIRNNPSTFGMKAIYVVTCSQKFVSLVSGTTRRRDIMGVQVLWLALKSLYLWYPEQHRDIYQSDQLCCDLLSKVCIFGIRNNELWTSPVPFSVVTCSQKFVSLVSGTTEAIRLFIEKQLWLALKSLYLWYPEQLLLLQRCCRCVVTCSQKFVSLVSGTTMKSVASG